MWAGWARSAAAALHSSRELAYSIACNNVNHMTSMHENTSWCDCRIVEAVPRSLGTCSLAMFRQRSRSIDAGIGTTEKKRNCQVAERTANGAHHRGAASRLVPTVQRPRNKQHIERPWDVRSKCSLVVPLATISDILRPPLSLPFGF